MKQIICIFSYHRMNYWHATSTIRHKTDHKYISCSNNASYKHIRDKWQHKFTLCNISAQSHKNICLSKNILHCTALLLFQESTYVIAWRKHQLSKHLIPCLFRTSAVVGMFFPYRHVGIIWFRRRHDCRHNSSFKIEWNTRRKTLKTKVSRIIHAYIISLP